MVDQTDCTAFSYIQAYPRYFKSAEYLKKELPSLRTSLSLLPP